MTDKLGIGKAIRKVFRMAAGTQNQGASLDGDGSGNGNGTANGSSGDSGNGTNNSGTDGNNDGSSGTNAGSGTGNVNDNDGSGNGSSVVDSGSYGFDGEFDPARARTLIDTLRQEKRETDRQLKELRELVEKGGKSKEEDKPKEGSSDSEALVELRKMREEIAEEKRLTKFEQLAKGIHPDAVEMAYSACRGDFDISDNGVVTNMTSVIESLRQRQPFLFAPETNGQNKNGSAGGGTHTAGGGKMYTEDEKASMRAFGMTPEQWEASKQGQPSS